MPEPEKAQAEIPYGVLEYTALFKSPILEAIASSVSIISAVLSALEPWGFSVEGVESPTTIKLKDYSLIFRRNRPGVTITLHLSKVVIVAENLDWKEAEDFVAGMSAGLNAITTVTHAQISSQQLGLAMHVQLKGTTTSQITAALVSSTALRLLDGEVKFHGIILKREKCSIIIDFSLAYTNALFVRLFREHSPEIPLQDLAEVLHKDEEQLFAVLGLEGVL